jgi:transposase
MRTSKTVALADGDSEELQRLVSARNTPQKCVLRAKIVLLSADGVSTSSIERQLQTSVPTITRWRERYQTAGVAGLLRDASRPGRKKRMSAGLIAEVVRRTVQEKPEDATHWSSRRLAKAMGISAASVQRIWKQHGLKPHRVRSFKLSRDPDFLAKLTDVVGLYVDPPEKALVLCVDEKSQIQALERTQPGLPMKKGRAGTMTHDYRRHGTTTLFAALNILTGDVIGQCLPRHRHDEFLVFLKKIDKETPADLDLHLVVDNYATHKHPDVEKWLLAHPRFHLHFIPTSSSWLNLVERFFAELTVNWLRRGVFRSVKELVDAIHLYLEKRPPKPFVWTASASSIIDKVNKANEVLEAEH